MALSPAAGGGRISALSNSAWYRLEAAKRRLLFTLIELGLPMPNRLDEPQGGLTFEFLADANPGVGPVLTGHIGGIITVNIAEADDAERERRRWAGPGGAGRTSYARNTGAEGAVRLKANGRTAVSP